MRKKKLAKPNTKGERERGVPLLNISPDLIVKH